MERKTDRSSQTKKTRETCDDMYSVYTQSDTWKERERQRDSVYGWISGCMDGSMYRCIDIERSWLHQRLGCVSVRPTGKSRRFV